LRGTEKFEGVIEFYIQYVHLFKPVKRSENKSGVSEFRSFNGTSKGVLDLLETMYLRLGKIVI